ncbi:MAG TPA: hypothetical protein VFB80_13300 [Pirellulaceae bacterium]|nr:hypothetical protein [Pirellulaceae bacterium]
MFASLCRCRSALTASLITCLLTGTARADNRDLIEVYKSRAEVISADAQNKQANAAIITAAATFTRAQAESAKMGQETREKKLQNDLLGAKVFYDKRALYHTYKDTHQTPRSTADQYTERARSAAPERLSSYQLWIKPGYVRWPSLLLAIDYSEPRSQIDYLLVRRTPADSGAGSQNCVDLQQQIDTLRLALQGRMRTYKPADYLAARKFLDSLAYEVQFPADFGGATAQISK